MTIPTTSESPRHASEIESKISLEKLYLILSRTSDPRDSTADRIASQLGISKSEVESLLRSAQAKGIVLKAFWNPRSFCGDSCWRLSSEGKSIVLRIFSSFLGSHLTTKECVCTKDHSQLLHYFAEATYRTPIRLAVHLIDTHRSSKDPFFIEFPALGDLLVLNLLKNDTPKGYLYFYIPNSDSVFKFMQSYTQNTKNSEATK